MGEVRGILTKDLEKEFRRLAMEKFGYRKGSLSKAVTEAINNWVENYCST